MSCRNVQEHTLIYRLILIALVLLHDIAEINADLKWDQVRFKGLNPNEDYNINMGSGFFVNDDTIVTNAHVVSNCVNIAIRGAVKPQTAELYTIDPELDLALLKTSPSEVKVPYIRNNYNTINEGDILFSVGYPLEHADSGQYIIKEAKVIRVFKDPKTEFSKLEFTDNVNNGNSGGPLLDKNSNLVGVVTAKHRYYDRKNPEITTREVAVAIGVEGLQKFLRLHNVAFASSSSYDMFTNYAVDSKAKNYVVNIHCIRLSN